MTASQTDGSLNHETRSDSTRPENALAIHPDNRLTRRTQARRVTTKTAAVPYRRDGPDGGTGNASSSGSTGGQLQPHIRPWRTCRRDGVPALFGGRMHASVPFFWSTGFLLGTGFAPRLWRPVLQGNSGTGDIIAPNLDHGGRKGPSERNRGCRRHQGGHRHPFSLHAKAHQGPLLSEPPPTSPDRNSVARSSRLRSTCLRPA